MKAATINNSDHNYLNKNDLIRMNDIVNDSISSASITAVNMERSESDLIHSVDKAIPIIDAEDENSKIISPEAIDYSSIRGKNVLVKPTDEQFDLLQKRLEERTRDNRGETIYDIGVGEGKSEMFIYI